MHTILAIILLPYVCVCVWTNKAYTRELKYMSDEEAFRQNCILASCSQARDLYLSATTTEKQLTLRNWMEIVT